VSEEWKVGDYAVIKWGRGANVRQIEKVTPKLVKVRDSWGTRQLKHADVYAVFADKADADRIMQSIDGVMGEHRRRVQAAIADRDLRVAAADAARDKQIEALLRSSRPIVETVK
jgi:hypothetical protein